jgi:feruloyl esterase
VNWVERGDAPAKTLQVSMGERSMPLCSYPTYPKYVSGPASLATSYTCGQ